jgi:phage-related minor tail protein
MTLDLGELVGYLVVDDKRWNFDGALKSMDKFGDQAKVRAGDAGEKAGDAYTRGADGRLRNAQGRFVAAGDALGGSLGDGLVPAAERAGEKAGEKAGDGLKAKGALAAAAAGAAVGAAFVEALDVDAAADKLVAQLGANAVQAERYGRVAGNLYAGAWGDSMDHVNEAIGAVVSSIDGMDKASGRQLGRLTSRALDFATAFDIDVARAVQVAGQLVNNDLAPNGIRAMDLLTRGAQRVQSALREDLVDAVDEYGQFFHMLGYSGKEAFDLLVKSSEDGMYGIDKTGDAIKEFGLLVASDMTKTKPVIKGLGLDYEEMANAFLTGGDRAAQARDKIVQGLLDIEDPAERARLAVELFGTPIEDLGLNGLPQFLRMVRDGSTEMDGFRGSSKRMSDQLNGNTRTDLTSFTRTMKTELVGYLEDKVIPVLEDDVIPAVKRFGDWFEKDGGPALRDFKDDLDPVIDAVGDLAGFLNDMPGEAKLVALGSVLAGGAALKVRGGGSGALGTAGSALGLTKPVPVIVMNKGFDGPGDGGGGAGKKGFLGALLANPLTWFATQAGVGTHLSNEHLADTAGSDVAVSMAGPQSQGGGGGLGAPPGFFDFSDDEVQKKSDDVDELVAKVNGFQDALDIVGSTKVRPDLAVPGLKQASQGISDFIDMQIEAGKPVHAAIFLTGIERAMAQIATLNAGINGLGERGLDNGVPYVHGGTPDRAPDRQPAGRSPFDGATFNVMPPNYDGFARDMQRRSRNASLGGRPAPGGRR